MAGILTLKRAIDMGWFRNNTPWNKKGKKVATMKTGPFFFFFLMAL